MRDLGEEADWYRHALTLLQKNKIPFLIGGAFALWQYTGVRRPTKDLDLFLRPRDLAPALKVLNASGCRTEITAQHWIGKAFHKDSLLDFIVGLANGVGQVDDSWFDKPVKTEMFEMELNLVRPEEMVWGKAFVMERDRYDGADIAHLIWAKGRQMNWNRLIRRFATHEAVLLAHLILFEYIYPDMTHTVPSQVFRTLQKRIEENRRNKSPVRLCRGTYFSRIQYAADIETRGYIDTRLLPYGTLTAPQLLE
jgi:hypothetical protein